MLLRETLRNSSHIDLACLVPRSSRGDHHDDICEVVLDITHVLHIVEICQEALNAVVSLWVPLRGLPFRSPYR